MNITQIPPANAPGSSAPVAEATNSGALSADFETFLQMLTAQARYQDPLEPIDSTEYAAQLAQFSMVEQQVQTNQAIENLTVQLAQNGLQDLSGWIGLDVRAALPVAFEGAPITLQPDIHPNAERAILVVRDGTGNEVQRQSIATDAETVTWTGLNDLGVALPVGTYSFEVESWAQQARISTTPVEGFRTVREVQTIDAVPSLILDDGSVITSAAITGVRDPRI